MRPVEKVDQTNEPKTVFRNGHENPNQPEAVDPNKYDADVRMNYFELELGAVTSGYTSDFAKETRVGTRDVTGQKSPSFTKHCLQSIVT